MTPLYQPSPSKPFNIYLPHRKKRPVPLMSLAFVAAVLYLAYFCGRLA